MKYNPALDGLRALAVLAVLLFHSRVPHFGMGWAGVDVFFVLSGYLITSILRAQQASGGIALGSFYLRRARRLYPALLLMLALYLATFPVMYEGPHLRDAAIAALYLADYSQIWHMPQIVAHTWSLSVEEHFYLIWPLVVIGLARIKTPRAVVYLLLSAYLLATFWRLYSDDYKIAATGFRFDSRMSGLILGSLLAYVPQIKHRAWVLAIAPLGYLLSRTTGSPGAVSIAPAEWLAAATILWAATGSASLLAWQPLAYLGRISYGIYLFHYPLAWFMRNADALWWQQASIVALISIPLAHFSHKYWEARWRQASGNGPVGVYGLDSRAIPLVSLHSSK